MNDPLPIHTLADWQTQLRQVVTSVDELLAELHLRPDQVDYSALASEEFALKVPLAFVRRMEPGNPRDPLLLQVLAGARETLTVPGYTDDPVGEFGDTLPRRGIIHKYRGRVLLVATASAAISPTARTATTAGNGGRLSSISTATAPSGKSSSAAVTPW